MKVVAAEIKVMVKSCSGRNNRGSSRSSFNGLSRLFCDGGGCRRRLSSLRGDILQRSNRSRLVDLGRVLVHLGWGGDLRLGFGLEEVTNTGRQSTRHLGGFVGFFVLLRLVLLLFLLLLLLI